MKKKNTSCIWNMIEHTPWVHRSELERRHGPSAWSAPCGIAAQVGAERGVHGGRGGVCDPHRRHRLATAAAATAVAGHLLLLFVRHARQREMGKEGERGWRKRKELICGSQSHTGV